MLKEASLEVTQGGTMIFRTTEFRVGLPKDTHVVKPYVVKTFRNVSLQGQIQHRLLLESVVVDTIHDPTLSSNEMLYFQHRTPFNRKSLDATVVDKIRRLLAKQNTSTHS